MSMCLSMGAGRGVHVTITHVVLDLTVQKHPQTWDLAIQGALLLPEHVQICLTWDLTTPSPSHVHYKARTVSKWAVRILLVCFLVFWVATDVRRSKIILQWILLYYSYNSSIAVFILTHYFTGTF